MPCCTGPCPKRLAFHANDVARCCSRLEADKRAAPSLRAVAAAMKDFAIAVADCDAARQQKLLETSDRADALLALANAQVVEVDCRMKELHDRIAAADRQLQIAIDDNVRKRGAIVALVELVRCEAARANS